MLILQKIRAYLELCNNIMRAENMMTPTSNIRVITRNMMMITMTPLHKYPDDAAKH